MFLPAVKTASLRSQLAGGYAPAPPAISLRSMALACPMPDELHTAPPPVAGRGKGGRPRLDPAELRRERRLTFSDAEWLRLGAVAELAGCSVSELIRRVIVADYAQSDPGALHTVKDRAAWSELARPLGNLNQVAHNLNLVAKGGEGAAVFLRWNCEH